VIELKPSGQKSQDYDIPFLFSSLFIVEYTHKSIRW
jgi:hypothetical protein